jgi:hypothetical protein
MPLPMLAQPTENTIVDVKLTPEQLRFFDTFGYLAFPGLIVDRIPQVIEAFESVWAGRGGGHDGKPHDHQARSCIVPFIDQSAELSSLLDDPRIHGIAGSLLGDDFNYLGSDGNYYVGDTPWHSDGAHQTERFIKIAFYLDPLSSGNGALRVIPGSHHLDGGFRQALDRSRDIQQAFGLPGSQVPAQTLAVVPGDVLVFNHNTFHSSWNGGTRRRMFTMNCCQRFPAEHLEELQSYIASNARFFIDRLAGPEMLRTASSARMRHLQQVMENDFMLPELSKRLRAERQQTSRG